MPFFFSYILILLKGFSREVVLWTCYVFAKVSRLCLHHIRNMILEFLSVRKSWPFVLALLPGESSLFLSGLSPHSEPTTSLISLIWHLPLLKTHYTSSSPEPVTSLCDQLLVKASIFTYEKMKIKTTFHLSFILLNERKPQMKGYWQWQSSPGKR